MKAKYRLDRQTMKEIARSADLSESPCRCDHPIPVESTTYSARCAESVLEVPS